MNQAMKRILSLAFVLILVVSLAAPAFAAGTVSTLDGEITVGMNYVNEDGSGYVWLNLVSSGKKVTVDRSKIKVSKGTSGAQFSYFSSSYNQTLNRIEYRNGSKWKTQSYSSKGNSFGIELSVKQAGTAKVVYYVGNTKHVVNLTITKKYYNPVKSATLTGVNSGKNFALSKYKGSGELKLNANVKSATLKIVPAKGWVLQEMGIMDQTENISRYLSTSALSSSGSIYWGKLIKSHSYHIYAYFYNTKTHVSQSINYSINVN